MLAHGQLPCRWTGAGQEQPEGLPPMPLVYRNESYGSYELKGSMEEKEVSRGTWGGRIGL